MSPQRIQRKRTKGWQLADISPGAVIVDRSTIYGNPFRAGVLFCGTTIRALHTQQELVDMFDEWVSLDTLDPRCWDRELIVAHVKLKSQLGYLRGRDLVCWCRLDQPCHADVLLRIANGGEA